MFGISDKVCNAPSTRTGPAFVFNFTTEKAGEFQIKE
jgi:hypothetical protein